ncbi:hypothetical protein CL644_02675 [bacterium]|nr:hypothetical protein [Parcubacteria group bacterium]MBF05588.1 hypothetical protein [bacterium]|tara:strand:+ start:23072 stop:23908 length:837 start_codon:yes stop_codon:yes gene_type:complete
MDQHIILFLIAAALCAAFLIYYYSRKPNHNRNWTLDQKELPSISTYGDLVTIHKVRNATYKNQNDYNVHYYDKTFRITDLKKLWLIIEPFGPTLPFCLQAAHVFVSFELTDGSFVSISVEIRKKEGDMFSIRGAINGILRYYELMYVVADEKDTIQLRTNHRKDDVLLYPLAVPQKTVQNIFKGFVDEINELFEYPSFFHTITHNCTTILVRNFRKNNITLPAWSILYLFPAHVDALFYSQNLIETKLSLKEARKYFHITQVAQKNGDTTDFSKKIRH